MDTFQLHWSIQKLVASKAYKEAGGPNEMWCNKHLKWHLIKVKEDRQSIEDFLAEFREMKTYALADVRLRIEYLVNGRYLDKVIKYSDPDGGFDLFFRGLFNSIEFVEVNRAHQWGWFLMKRFLGEEFTENDIIWLDHPYSKRKQFEEDQENGVQLYCCGACGDRKCGGWDMTVYKRDNTIVWDSGVYTEGKLINYYFDLAQYQQAFAEYKSYLERKVNSNKSK